MGAIAVCAYSYMALVPVIQPPLMRLLTTKKERVIKMKPAPPVSQTENILFPIIGLLLTTFIVPSGLPLLGMLFFGNLLKESGKTSQTRQDSRQQPERHRGDAPRSDSRLFHPGIRISDPQHHQDIRPWSLGIHL